MYQVFQSFGTDSVIQSGCKAAHLTVLFVALISKMSGDSLVEDYVVFALMLAVYTANRGLLSLGQQGPRKPQGLPNRGAKTDMSSITALSNPAEVRLIQ